MCLVFYLSKYPTTRIIGCIHLILSLVSLVLAVQEFACIVEIMDLFGVKSERYKGAGWMVSLMLNSLEVFGALCLLWSSFKTGAWNGAAIQYCFYWFTISSILLATFSIQFFFSFRSSLPVILFYMGHVSFLGLAMLLVRDYVEELEHVRNGYATVSLHIPNGSSYNFDSRSITPSDRTPETMIHFV